MEHLKPAPIDLPPPKDEHSLLAFYLEGVPLVQIARALQITVPAVLAIIRQPEVQACIRQYEEILKDQTRLFALAARAPAMTVLREICVSQASLAERRRAASDLLRQSRAADKPAQGMRFNRSPHRTAAPEKSTPPADQSSDVAPIGQPLEANAEAPPYTRRSPAPDQATVSPHPQPSATAAATTREHTASWHAFESDEPAPPSSSDIHPPAPSPATALPPPPESTVTPPQPAAHKTAAHPPPVAQQSGSIPSPYDAIGPRELSTPLPDAVPLAA